MSLTRASEADDNSRGSSSSSRGILTDDSKSGTTQPGAWIQDLEVMFSLPMVFPYPIISGFSVAPGVNSPPSSGAGSPSSSVTPKVGGSNGLSRITRPTVRSKGPKGAGSSPSSSLQRDIMAVSGSQDESLSSSKPTSGGVESLPIWELLESLHEDFLHAQRPQRRSIKLPAKEKVELDGIKTRIRRLRVQIELIEKVGSFYSKGPILAKLQDKMLEVARLSGDSETLEQALMSVLALKKRGWTKNKTCKIAFSVAAAQWHSGLGDFYLDNDQPKRAMEQFEAALAYLGHCVWSSTNEEFRGDYGELKVEFYDSTNEEYRGDYGELKVAECLHKVGQSALSVYGNDAKPCLEFLEKAKVICEKVLARDDETGGGAAECILGNVLVTMGDAHRQTEEYSRALACYQNGSSIMMRQGKTPEAILDSWLAIADLHCTLVQNVGDLHYDLTEDAGDLHRSHENARQALTYLQRVNPQYSHSAELYEYMLLKRAILHFSTGNIEAAQADLRGYLSRRHALKENGSDVDLAYFAAIISAGACHQLEKQSTHANQYYKEAHALVGHSQVQNCRLLEENPMLETALWNFMEEWLHDDSNGDV